MRIEDWMDEMRTLSGGIMFGTCARSFRTIRTLRGISDCTVLRRSAIKTPLYRHIGSVEQVKRDSVIVCAAEHWEKQGNLTLPQKLTEPWAEVETVLLLLLIAESYTRQTGKALLEGADIANITEDLFHAPFCLMAHEFPDEDDEAIVVTYANNAALSVMDCDWDDVVGTPSTLFDDDVIENAFENGHLSGLTVKLESRNDTTVDLQDVELVNITSPDDEVIGQAILFSKWLLEDGTEAGPDYIPKDEIPTEEDLSMARQKVEEIAARVREMKEKQGLTNDDPSVKAAVDELLMAKDDLADLEEKFRAATEQKDDPES